jgi:hypothetical protein
LNFFSKKKNELLPALEKESVGTVSEELIEDLLKIQSTNKYLYKFNSPSPDIPLLLFIRFSNAFLIGAKFALI